MVWWKISCSLLGMLGLVSVIILLILVSGHSHRHRLRHERAILGEYKESKGSYTNKATYLGSIEKVQDAQRWRSGSMEVLTDDSSPLQAGDVIITGDSGQVLVNFDDGSRFGLGNNSQLRIDAFHYRGDDLITNELRWFLEYGKIIARVGNAAIGLAEISTQFGTARCRSGSVIAIIIENLATTHRFILIDKVDNEHQKKSLYSSVNVNVDIDDDDDDYDARHIITLQNGMGNVCLHKRGQSVHLGGVNSWIEPVLESSILSDTDISSILEKELDGFVYDEDPVSLTESRNKFVYTGEECTDGGTGMDAFTSTRNEFSVQKVDDEDIPF